MMTKLIVSQGVRIRGHVYDSSFNTLNHKDKTTIISEWKQKVWGKSEERSISWKPFYSVHYSIKI